MAIIFNSITQFVQQPERTKRRVKRDDLDTVTEVWVGPTVLEDGFAPRIGTAHPEANLMTVIDTSIKRMPASVSEVTISYHGKLDNSGTRGYTSVPAISQYWAEGEVSYQSGTTTISRRYTGRCVTVVYLTNRRPTGNPTNLGLSKAFLGFTNVWEMITGFVSGGGGATTPIQKITCTDVKVDDRADGWYRVTETYQSRQFPGPAQPSDPGGSISVKTTLSGAWNDTSSADTSGRTTGAAIAAAANQNQTLSSSAAGTAEYDTFLATQIDPSWAPVANAIAAATGSSFVDPTNVGITSVNLSY